MNCDKYSILLGGVSLKAVKGIEGGRNGLV